MSLRGVVALLTVLTALGAVCAGVAAQTRATPGPAAERRIALVIGNGDYPSAPLRNPANDARRMARALGELGFEVALQENVDQRQMRRLIIQFGDKIREGGIGLFFYAGHGMQVGGRNYMIPIDADVKSEAEVESDAVDVAAVLARMETARNRLNIVILDACRDNPFVRRFRSSTKGLASIDAPVGTLIAYATAPGSVALDGTGPNSIYTGELADAIATPGLRIEEVFKRVRQTVRVKTQGKQIPWEASSLEGEFVFAERRDPASARGVTSSDAPRATAPPAVASAPPAVTSAPPVAAPPPPASAPSTRPAPPPIAAAPSSPAPVAPPTRPAVPPAAPQTSTSSVAPQTTAPPLSTSPPPPSQPPVARPPATPSIAAIPPATTEPGARERAAGVIRTALQRRTEQTRFSGGATVHDRYEIHDVSAGQLSLTVSRTVTGGGRNVDGRHARQRIDAAFDKLDLKSTTFSRRYFGARNLVELCFMSRDVEVGTSDTLVFPREPYVCLELQAANEDDLVAMRTALETLSGKTLAPIR